MDEEPPPKKKKTVNLEEGLINIQNNLQELCLCHVSHVSLDRLRKNFATLWSDQTSLCVIDPQSCRDHTLSLASTVGLVCQISMKQYSKGFICSKIAFACNALKSRYNAAINNVIKLFACQHADQYVYYSVSRALCSLFLLAYCEIDRANFDTVISNAILRYDEAGNIIFAPSNNDNDLPKVTFILEIIKRLVDWEDVEELTVNESHDFVPNSDCQVIQTQESHETYSEVIDNNVKICIEALGSKWAEIGRGFHSLLVCYNLSYERAILTFINLWRSIVSIKRNLSVDITRPFYSNLNQFLSDLSFNIPRPVWNSTLDLFNEVLCYGSTLALQDILDEEPCSFARFIVNDVKKGRKGQLLNNVPYQQRSSLIDGDNETGDKLLLQKVVLLVLKSVAVVVKEMRCDSSSDSSLDSEAEEEMMVVVVNMRKVLLKLDTKVKKLLNIMPETDMATWIVALFEDQFDLLIEGMLCCLDMHVGLCFQTYLSVEVKTSLKKCLDPSVTFSQFWQLAKSPDTLLSFLISNETCFLLYFHNLLKYHIIRNWTDFASTCGNNLRGIMDTLNALRKAISKLVEEQLFPYDIKPVLKNLKKCKQLYDG